MLRLDPFTGNVVQAGGVALSSDPTNPQAYILPPQAWADNIYAVLGGVSGAFASKGFTFFHHVLPSLAFSHQAGASQPLTVDLQGNSLAASNVDAILAQVAADSYGAVGTLYLAGTNMGKPTPAIAHVDGSLTIDFSAVDMPPYVIASGTLLSLPGNTAIDGFSHNITFDNSIPLSSSSLQSDEIFIGVQDSPALSDAVAMIASLCPLAHLLAGSPSYRVRFDYPSETDFPLADASIIDTNVAQFAKVSGTAETINADLATLIGASWHGSYKRYDGTTATF